MIKKILKKIYLNFNEKRKKKLRELYYFAYAKCKRIKIKKTNNKYFLEYKNKKIIINNKQLWYLQIIKEIASEVKTKIDFTKKTYFKVNHKKHYVDNDYEYMFAIKKYNQNYQVKKGDVVLDVGSYQGIYALYIYDKIQPNGKIYCFEPDPHNFITLKKNIKKYKLKNVILIKKALFNKSTEIEFDLCGDGSTLFSTDKSKNKIKIKTISTIDFIKKYNLTTIDFVKMDVEGAELEIIPDFLKNKITTTFAIASYHIRNKNQTYKLLEKIFLNNKWKVETKNKPHLTTYAQK